METTIKWKTGTPPDGIKRYLVTYEDGAVGTCIWSSADSFYHQSKGQEYHWTSSDGGKILAYAELPEPYKEES